MEGLLLKVVFTTVLTVLLNTVDNQEFSAKLPFCTSGDYQGLVVCYMLWHLFLTTWLFFTNIGEKGAFFMGRNIENNIPLSHFTIGTTRQKTYANYM